MADGRRAAIVTGSATGIGAGIVTYLAGRGWDVVVNYTRREADARATAAACEALGARVLVSRADVASDDDCRRLVGETVDAWGRVDGLVNNAGVTVFADANDLDALSADDFQRILGINLVGAYQMTRAAAPHLRESPVASVVNISSHGAFSGLGSSIAYAVSKGALNTLTLALARSLAPDIRVNAVCPGFVETGWMLAVLAEDEFPAFRRRVEAISPLRRMPKPEDVAEAVGWFLEGGRLITGQFLVVDGGVHLTVNTPVDAPPDA